MIRSVMILKYRRGRNSPSARTLRRAVRPARVRVGVRVVIFLVLLTLMVGAIGIWLNLKFETWEREHPAMQHTL